MAQVEFDRYGLAYKALFFREPIRDPFPRIRAGSAVRSPCATCLNQPVARDYQRV